MPGLAGFTSLSNLSPQELDARLQALKSNFIVPHGYVDHDLLFGPQTAGTLVCPQQQHKIQTYQNDTGLIGWLDGRIFNRDTLCNQHNWAFETDLEFLVSVATNPDHQRALKNIDGLFSAVILDTHKNRLHILTDRYGLRPLYWLSDKTGLSWSSEPKAFLQLPNFSPQISTETATAFLVMGQLPTDHTWFKGVQQVPPATHFTYNISTGALSRERYWWWDQVPSRVAKTKTDDLIGEFGRLFQEAVARRSEPTAQQGVMLSGGLDSRAVFAALPSAPPTFTFGQTDSDEVKIASDVAAVKLAPHTILPINEDNWLQPRIQAVWWTDGALNLIHMHGAEHLSTIGQTIHTCFNGAGGDGLAGAGHLFEPHELSHYLAENLHLSLQGQPKIRQQLEKTFQNARSAHAFYIDWRMRGFTIHGPRMGLFTGVDYALPFLDNPLQEFLFGLPLSVKQNNSLYTQMLLKTFPTYFQDIPWAKTGKPITWSRWAVRSARAIQKIKRTPSRPAFTNYPDWFRHGAAKNTIETLLNTATARYHNVVSQDTFSQIWAEHLSGEDRSETLGRYLTLEIYLRQVFDKQYRTSEETDSLFTP